MSVSSVLILILHCAVFAAALLGAYEDVRFMRIRNSIALAVALLFVPMVFLLPLNAIIAHLAAGGILFAICAGLFFAGLFGGGDAKLIGAAALWPPLHDLPAFLMIMTLAGGVLALAGLALKNRPFLTRLKQAHPAVFGPEEGWLASLSRGEAVVPYGAAIALAVALTLF